MVSLSKTIYSSFPVNQEMIEVTDRLAILLVLEPVGDIHLSLSEHSEFPQNSEYSFDVLYQCKDHYNGEV